MTFKNLNLPDWLAERVERPDFQAIFEECCKDQTEADWKEAALSLKIAYRALAGFLGADMAVNAIIEEETDMLALVVIMHKRIEELEAINEKLEAEITRLNARKHSYDL